MTVNVQEKGIKEVPQKEEVSVATGFRVNSSICYS